MTRSKQSTESAAQFVAADCTEMALELTNSLRHNRFSQVFVGCLCLIIMLLVYLPFSSNPGGEKLRQFTMDEVTIVRRTRFFEVDGNPINLFYLEAMPAMHPEVETALRVPILLLHGAAFTSKVWSDTRTLHLLASLGHRAIAVDLPGYGRTAAPDNLDPYLFMAATIYELHLGRPIIIAPSLGGKYALAYLMHQPETAAQRSRGLLAVASVGFEKYSADMFRECTASTWFVYGDEDRKIAPRSLAKFSEVPGVEIRKIAEAGHACYIDNPEAWLKLLTEFVHQIDKEVLRSPY